MIYVKTVFSVPYLRGDIVTKNHLNLLVLDPLAIKSCAIESRDIELFKKSNESF